MSNNNPDIRIHFANFHQISMGSMTIRITFLSKSNNSKSFFTEVLLEVHFKIKFIYLQVIFNLRLFRLHTFTIPHYL